MILKSFGFKYGPPRANYYFDVSFIKNPARQENWDLYSKIDNKMKDFVLSQKKTKDFMEKIIPVIEMLDTLDGGVVVAFGCNAGRHRSVILVEEIAKQLEKKGYKINVEHTDLA